MSLPYGEGNSAGQELGPHEETAVRRKGRPGWTARWQLSCLSGFRGGILWPRHHGGGAFLGNGNSANSDEPRQGGASALL